MKYIPLTKERASKMSHRRRKIAFKREVKHRMKEVRVKYNKEGIESVQKLIEEVYIVSFNIHQTLVPSPEYVSINYLIDRETE